MNRPSTTFSKLGTLAGFQLGSYCARPGTDFTALGHEEMELNIPAKEVNEQRG